MSVHVSSAVWRMRGISSTEKLILLYLADKADDTGSNAYPAVATIADECCVDERTVQRTLARLLERGAIEVQQEHDRSAHRPTTYRVDRLWGGNLSPQRGDTRSPGRVTSDPVRGGTVSPDPIREPSDTHPESDQEPLTIQQEQLARHLRKRVMDDVYGARTGVLPPAFGEAEIRDGATSQDINEAVAATLGRPAGALYGARGAAFALGCIRNALADRKDGGHDTGRGDRGTGEAAPARKAVGGGIRTGGRRGAAPGAVDSRYDYERPVPSARRYEAPDGVPPTG